MDKNTIMAIMLSAIVLIGSMALRSKFFPPPEPARPTTTTEQIATITETPEQVSLPNTVAATPRISGLDEIVVETEEKNAVITTNLAKVTFTNRGGDVISYELLEHKDGSHGIQMADNISAINRAFAVSFGGAENSI
jgi:YidC/Oxa1 family membrane protein insertase